MSETPLFRRDSSSSSLCMWHPHVYKSPPKRLTPFFIQDILKLAAIRGQKRYICDSSLGETEEEEDDYETEEEIPEPLNLSLCNSQHDSSNNRRDHVRHLGGRVIEKSITYKKGVKRKKLLVSSSSLGLPPASSFEDEEEEDDKKKKKVRTTFTGRQIFELEKMFESKKYLSSSERSDMAKILNVTEQQVKIWFQNRRTKWKKQENISNAEAAEHMKNKKSATSPHLSNSSSSGSYSPGTLAPFEPLSFGGGPGGGGSVSSGSRPSSSMRSSPPPHPSRSSLLLLPSSIESEEDEFREGRRSQDSTTGHDQIPPPTLPIQSTTTTTSISHVSKDSPS
eukprot:TRINITY_DN5236_c0_g1_i1.p1 TRINITY_DN5236_c0_g1~~TRINITY_DN5236_c0_g1_i1.p1  ORF type:complete len:337 (-),score=121.83 TRINITY_DN5236_c0_g1_i1:279-1289(-)